MSELFTPGKQAILKDGWVNGHYVAVAHVKGTDEYTVKIDDLPEVRLSTRAAEGYIYLMTKPVDE